MCTDAEEETLREVEDAESVGENGGRTGGGRGREDGGHTKTSQCFFARAAGHPQRRTLSPAGLHRTFALDGPCISGSQRLRPPPPLHSPTPHPPQSPTDTPWLPLSPRSQETIYLSLLAFA